MSVFWSITFKTTAPQNVTDNTEGISQFQLRPALPLPADPRVLAFFFFLPWMANSRGWGILSCQIPRGGDEKRGRMPRPLSTPQHFSLIAQSKSAVQYRKWSPTANDPETANDPRPQVIPKVDRKWSRKKNRNDLDSRVGGSSCRFYCYYKTTD